MKGVTSSVDEQASGQGWCFNKRLWEGLGKGVIVAERSHVRVHELKQPRPVGGEQFLRRHDP